MDGLAFSGFAAAVAALKGEYSMVNEWRKSVDGKWELLINLPSGAVITTTWSGSKDEPTQAEREFAENNTWKMILKELEGSGF